jgi:hypothetical protein
MGVSPVLSEGCWEQTAAIKLLIDQTGRELSWDYIVLLSHSRIRWESYA